MNPAAPYSIKASRRTVRAVSERAGSRLAALDALRGLLMGLMALDHARGFIARDHPSEFWGGWRCPIMRRRYPLSRAW